MYICHWDSHIGAGNMIASEKFDTMCFSKGLVEANGPSLVGGWRNDLRLGGPKEWGDDFCRFMFVYSKDHMI